MNDARWRAVLVPVGGVYLLLGLWAAAHPPSFHLALANYGPLNAVRGSRGGGVAGHGHGSTGGARAGERHDARES